MPDSHALSRISQLRWQLRDLQAWLRFHRQDGPAVAHYAENQARVKAIRLELQKLLEDTGK